MIKEPYHANDVPLRRIRPTLASLMAGILMVLGAGCKSTPVNQVELMPAPDVFGNGMLNPLPSEYPFDSIPYDGILYATDRVPAGENDKEAHYLNEHGYVIRLGFAEIQFGQKDYSWEKVREISLLKARSDTFPVKIKSVVEWGMMGDSLPDWVDLEVMPPEERPEDGSHQFYSALDSQLASSPKKDIYIYIHGYRVGYENPVLVSAELWHFLGYQGAFIAYSWPSTPSRYAYFRDTDTSVGFARNLRILLEGVIENTDVENIHIIGYSNGTRLVMRAMEQLAMKHQELTDEEIHEKLKIRNVALLGSDLDRRTFGAFMADDVFDISEHVSIYVSPNDRALGLAQFLTRRARLGQMWNEKTGGMHPVTRKALDDMRDHLSFINVSKAEGSDTGKGHGYFRSSPWVSSDLLMTLYYGLKPEQRGLVSQEDMPVYTFPDNYISELWSAIQEVDPVFAENYRRLQEQNE